ncbi:MAG: 16S rRNA (cytosine(1402)-N(4))-methyltransferase, partial [Candidatus Tectomicrobia bacterium]|nr:16S rRNA (cytosine(1402)-N(4))-methyltransferase [Candidatus Tectomicrobia bacterium]
MDVTASIQHRSVMQQELLDWLLPQRSDAVIIDCTLGGGGHSRAFLQAEPSPGLVIGMDRDPACIAAAQAWGAPWGNRFVPVQ